MSALGFCPDSKSMLGTSARSVRCGLSRDTRDIHEWDPMGISNRKDWAEVGSQNEPEDNGKKKIHVVQRLLITTATDRPSNLQRSEREPSACFTKPENHHNMQNFCCWEGLMVELDHPTSAGEYLFPTDALARCERHTRLPPPSPPNLGDPRQGSREIPSVQSGFELEE
ncbi:hypothetical protein BDK51DRAFT_26106 [Blyttiomyces helicus]|uniref:Uncharacterized protein n=1 Tax=Blyttiomyces helicus TaxID=388810 RepID=A0A4V1ISG8_9FUNG|nr:hypothetical protein BDK51DRAFT_26106 [Blyttiomyces helicus]|eukprot:RKO93507.1 hypothetical protein BDK51DRAFT_26106 [Blyttiomyces helicus]